MKHILTACFLLTGAITTYSQTVDEAVTRFTDGNGGKERLNNITTLQINSTLKLSQMNMQSPIAIVREKNKLFRIQSTPPMGGEESYTLITDTAGYTYTPAIQGMGGFQGADATLTKLSAEELKQQQYLTDCAGFFAPLVDYAAKGNTATYAGADKVKDVECDKVKLVLSSGQEVTYFIAKTNGQVKRMQLQAMMAMEMMGMSNLMRMFGGAQRLAGKNVTIDFDKYKIFDGYPFPTIQQIKLGMMELEIENTSFKVNQPVDAKLYKVTK